MNKLKRIFDVRTSTGWILGLIFRVVIIGLIFFSYVKIAPPLNILAIIVLIAIFIIVFIYDYLSAKKNKREQFLFPNSYHVIRSPIIFIPLLLCISVTFWFAVAPWSGIIVGIIGMALFFLYHQGLYFKRFFRFW